MLTECPHCFTDVLVKSDGTCPACLGNANDRPEADANMTKATLSDGSEKLPPLCISCGEATRRAVRFSRSAPNPRFSYSGLSVFGLVRLLDRLSGKMEQQIILRLPQCKACASDGVRIRTHHLDFENGMVTLIVHKRFRQALDVRGR